MGKLIYTAIASLDGYVADADGTFEWSAPDEEVHAFVNEVERPARTHLYGRRMYDVLKVWQSLDIGAGSAAMRDYGEIWRAADKIVYSRTLEEPAPTPKTRIEREFDPEAVRALKETAEGEIAIGGPELAGQAIRAGLVDEIHLFLNPVVVGGGHAALPDGVRVTLELLAEHRFAGGVIHLHYRVAR